jgi:hypothetical protein
MLIFTLMAVLIFFSSFPLTSVAQPGDDLELLIVDQTI